ncbi:13104_t:CDS:10 [Acaulospora morrowiae]|uniref:DNA polymerase n=1 Tax=Acaulospora morrowiae TaxID=94023 RepID=A0A9N9BDE5_9GLOM|nr:13104_t:CDS:10 [Acaulospora morrowiae]
MSVHLQKRRATVKDTSTFDTLRRLRETGGSRLMEYEVKEEDAIYIEVNEEEYQSHIREELKTNDFIEDDDGKAHLYAEDDLGKEYSEESELESDYDESPTKDGKRKRTRKIEEKSSNLVKPEQRINNFFQRAATQLLKPKTVKTTEEERAFMTSLLQELDDETGDQDLDVMQIPTTYSHDTYKEYEVGISSQISDIIMNDLSDQNYSTEDNNMHFGQPSIDEKTALTETSPMELVNDNYQDIDWFSGAEIECDNHVHVMDVTKVNAINPKDQETRITHNHNDSYSHSSQHSVSEKIVPKRTDHIELVHNNQQNSNRFTDEEIMYTDYAHINDDMNTDSINPQKDQEIDNDTNTGDSTKFYWIDAYEKQGIVYLFGKSSALELFLVKRKIRGPCWLEIKNAQIEQKKISWCKVELTVENPKCINPVSEVDLLEPLKPPPLRIMSLSLRTVMNHQKHVNEIVAFSARVYSKVFLDGPISAMNLQSNQFTSVRQLNDKPWWPIKFEEMVKKRKNQLHLTLEKTEFSLLNRLLAILKQNDPDVIVGHNFIGFDLDVLLHRMKMLKIKDWSSLGRLHRQTFPLLHVGNSKDDFSSSFVERDIVSGRLICDTYQSAKEFIKSKNFSLTELVSSHLKVTRKDVDYERIASNYDSAEALYDMILHCRYDSILTSELMFKLQLLPLTKQLTNLSGNVWSKTLNGARANRNDYLLLHEFHKLKYICPDKYSHKSKSKAIMGDEDEDENIKGTRKKSTYAGGLVLDPKSGFYDKFVVLLDFNSLYPSIIQEYNICFTTVARTGPRSEDQVPEVPDADESQGVLPKLIANFVERRRQVKKCMNDPNISTSERDQYDVRQRALKLTANSMYGCLGTKFSRFYAKPLAMLITSKGREILQNTVELAENENMQVIYGDTDSIMICTNASEIKEAMEVGRILRRKVNERYKLIEIEIEGFFEKLLLLKKKKYAAIKLEIDEVTGRMKSRVPETKGLDLVRRDWCELVIDASHYVLDQILSEFDREVVLGNIHEYMSKLGRDVRSGKFPINKFIIHKVLAKAPEDYPDAKSQPHVQVALRMKKRGLSARQGDTIPYIICKKIEEGSASNSLFEKAFHPDEIRHDANLQIDSEWYLTQQVHASVTRLIEPIDGTDGARIADCLGIDSSRSSNTPSTFRTFESRISNEERFKNVDKFNLKCTTCKQSSIYDGTKSGHQLDASGIICGNVDCKKVLPLPSILTQLTCNIRSHIKRYYDGWLVCEEKGCGYRTRMITAKRKCIIHGCYGVMINEYSESMLHSQLLYYSHLFDVDKIRISPNDEYPSVAKYWCGKPYIPKNKLFKNIQKLRRDINQCSKRATLDSTENGNDSFSSVKPSTIRLPPTCEPIPIVPNLSNGYTATFRNQPYLSTDSIGSLLVTVTNTTPDIAVKASLDDGTEILAATRINIEENVIEVPFSIAKIVPKLKAYDVEISFHTEDDDISLHTTYSKLYRLPAGPKTVKVDRLYGGIFTSTNKTIFPVGPYVDVGGWLAKGNIRANLQTLKDLNYNIINPDPPYPNISFIHQMFQAADAIGELYIQYSFRHDYTDTQKVIDQVNQFKNYSSLLTWYIADEPDGEQWINTSAVFEAYEVIKRVDPYHPAALVLNCQHSSAFYADSTDILITDVYPVGINTYHCTEYSGVCGCDNCVGNFSIDIPKRTKKYMADLNLIGRELIVKWMVLQAFYDQNSWWERSPTLHEIRAMWYISIISGYKGLMFWRFPFILEHSINDQITTLSKRTKDLSDYMLSMSQLPPSHIIISPDCNINVGGWISGDQKTFLLIMVSGSEEFLKIKITIKDLISYGFLYGVGETDREKESQVFIENGIFEGNLKAYEVGIFIFKR